MRLSHSFLRNWRHRATMFPPWMRGNGNSSDESLEGCIQSVLSRVVEFRTRGVTREEKGAKLPDAELHWWREITAGDSKIPYNVARTFFDTEHFLPKELRFEYGEGQTCFMPRALSNLVTPLLRMNFVLRSYLAYTYLSAPLHIGCVH